MARCGSSRTINEYANDEVIGADDIQLAASDMERSWKSLSQAIKLRCRTFRWSIRRGGGEQIIILASH